MKDITFIIWVITSLTLIGLCSYYSEVAIRLVFPLIILGVNLTWTLIYGLSDIDKVKEQTKTGLLGEEK